MTVPMEEINAKVNEILVKEFELEADDLKLDANVYEDLGLDSLDSVDLIVALEKAFDFKISREHDEEKIKLIRTIKDICDFIDSKQEK